MLALLFTLGVVMVVFILPISSYVHDAKHLRKFPSPSIAGLSSLWRIWQNLKRKHYQAIDEAHQKLGTHVRIAPNHVSISDPAAMPEIYGHGANLLKDAFYDGGAGEFRNLADTRVKAEHQAKRRMLGHVFAQRSVTNLEPAIASCIETLMNCVDNAAKTDQPINMRRYFNYFTIDAFSKILYGDTLRCLERGTDMVTAETKSGKTYQAPYIKALHGSQAVTTTVSMEPGLLPLTKKLFSVHPHKKDGDKYDDIIYHNTLKRMKEDRLDNDIFSRMIKNGKGEATNLQFGEILAECSIMMNGGTDTMASAITYIFFLLTKNPRVLKKLREELDAAIPAEVIVPKYETLAALPYLRAVVEETLRVKPASTLGLPRIVPQGGRKIAGQWIEEGVTVSVPTYTLLRNADCFDHAEEFIPERWTESSPEQKAEMNTAHMPFSFGPRSCIARNIAYFEQLLVVGALVRAFDFEFVDGDGFEIKVMERFNSNPGEMWMKCHRRLQVGKDE
jgi:cytochrome P450